MFLWQIRYYCKKASYRSASHILIFPKVSLVIMTGWCFSETLTIVIKSLKKHWALAMLQISQYSVSIEVYSSERHNSRLYSLYNHLMFILPFQLLVQRNRHCTVDTGVLVTWRIPCGLWVSTMLAGTRGQKHSNSNQCTTLPTTFQKINAHCTFFIKEEVIIITTQLCTMMAVKPDLLT